MNDIRCRTPNQDGYRKGRFRIGWHAAVDGEDYTENALNRLTWQNTGWRLGKVLGIASDKTIDAFYDLCVRQQAESGRSTEDE